MTESQQYDFGDNMRMSQGCAVNTSVSDILIDNVPGVFEARLAPSRQDKNGTDWFLHRENGKPLRVDCKVRREDWSIKDKPEDDLALETWSVIEDRVLGWTRDATKETDYILWLWKDTGRWCLIPFPLLCQVFQSKWEEWRSAFKTRQQETPWRGGSYHSECVFVPRSIVWKAIYQRYGGKPAA